SDRGKSASETPHTNTGILPAPSTTAPTQPELTKPIFSAPAPVGDLPAPPADSDRERGRPGSPETAASTTTTSKPGVEPHLDLFAKNNYPSARECAQCHEEIYKDWSISAHAYAAVSPMFNKFE